MPDLIDRLGDQVAQRLRGLGFSEPKRALLDSLLRLVYQATLKTEEGRFVRGSLTYTNPRKPDVDPPCTQRADFPAFTHFTESKLLTVNALVKLARAVDQWSGSIAVYGRRDEIVAWGVLDQLVGQSVRLHRESLSGFVNPGILTVSMDGVGDISVFSSEVFLGAIKGQGLVAKENDALSSSMVTQYGFDALVPYAHAIASVLRDPKDTESLLSWLFYAWSTNIARLCIGLRRIGCGGAFLLTPQPLKRRLHIGHAFSYDRLSQSTILSVLDEEYRSRVEILCRKYQSSGSVPYDLFIEKSYAEADMEDRRDEVTGAVKLVTSLAAVDGLVLMTPMLSVSGFGVKIGGGPTPGKVFDGADFARRGSRATTIDTSRFGTRHGSMLGYCSQDRRALGLVISQDGEVRLIMSSGTKLVMWDDLKLLGHSEYSKERALSQKRRRVDRARKRHLHRLTLGFTNTPKTLLALMREAHLATRASRRRSK